MHLRNDIIIGREVLSSGFNVVVSPGQFEIVRSKTVNYCSNDEQLCELNTDLVGEDLDKLKSLMEKYSKSFINGIPLSRVSSGEMKIKLVDPNRIVQRRPY